jgi:hypothetical protein
MGGLPIPMILSLMSLGNTYVHLHKITHNHVILWGFGSTYVETMEDIINRELQAMSMFILHITWACYFIWDA